MKIKHIYITKEGEPMANPEMEYPEGKYKSDESGFNFDEALAKYHSGLLPFEDQEKAKYSAWMTAQSFPDGLYSVDLEVEVVEQYRNKKSSDWYGYDTKLNGPKDFEPNDYEYRKVLRIKS